MFSKVEMSNGMTLVTIPMKEMRSVSVGVWVRAGSRFEDEKNSGVSHFIEHLVFKGTKNKSVKKIKESIEGRGGLINAFTSEEVTCYYVKVLKKHLPVAVDLLLDLVYNPLFRTEDIEMERAVILEEIKMYRDLPHHHVQDILNEMLWPEHSLGRPILGTNTTIGGMSRQDIVNYKNRLYQNSHFVFSVSGDVVTDEVESLVRKKMTSGKAKPKVSFSEFRPMQKKHAIRFSDKQTEQTHFVMGYHSGSRNDPKKHNQTLLHVLLGGNMSSRLFDEVREKRGLAYEIRSSLSLFQDTGAFIVSAGVENGKSFKTLQIIFRELQKIREKSVSASELRRAKDYYLGQLALLLESTMENMLWHGEKLMYSKKIDSFESIRSKVEEASATSIREMANTIFTSRNLNMAFVGKLEQQEKDEINKLVESQKQ